MNANLTEGSVMKGLREGNKTPARDYLKHEGKSWAMGYLEKHLETHEAEDVYKHSADVVMEICGQPSFELRRPLITYFKDIIESQCAILMVHEGGEKRKQVMREIAEEHRGPLERYLATKVRSEDVQDLASQSLVMVIENILDGKFKGRSSLDTYLWSIVRNQVKKWYGRKVTEDHDEEETNSEEIANSPETGFIRKELQEKVAEVVGQLGEKCPKVLRMWMMKYRMKEIAETMGYASEAVARNTKKRCFQKLEKLIREDLEVKRLLTELL